MVILNAKTDRLDASQSVYLTSPKAKRANCAAKGIDVNPSNSSPREVKVYIEKYKQFLERILVGGHVRGGIRSFR